MALEDAGAVSPNPERPQDAGTPGSTGPADPARLVGDERLPCGRLVSEAWDQARTHADRRDPHMAGCPHCRQAAEGLVALDRATRVLRDERPSARMVADRVIEAVRAETRLGRLLPLDDCERDLRVAETSAAKVLRRAADTVPGVRAASCRLFPDEHGGTAVDIVMTLASTLDRPLPARGAQVRRAVAYAAQRQLGLAARRIDLKFVSVLETGRRPAAGRPVGTSGP
ncbi:hypothetical protein [Actinacidiphila rubida]|uniref:Asp23/Gls24 family envelope stress response protein n=1 Tax=Actinacidiphila rubida TaxID=310780 RepID=A0A1H8EKV9_9ACTN|nr:hypothetical protein [Actinacidiphila rubida]SEN20113.1 hypothetical protein SAMN05216267_1002262 [Actinacidiphila rubida]